MDKIKIIFLDIDGVLNHQIYYTNRVISDEELEANWPLCDLCDNSVRYLNQIVNATGAKVVLSSTWRLGNTIEEVQEALERKGFVGKIIDKTDYFKPMPFYTCRGNEIEDWIRNHEDELGKYYEFEDYVILDDDSDMLYRHRNNYVKIDPYIGLTPYTAALAVNILNKLLS